MVSSEPPATARFTALLQIPATAENDNEDDCDNEVPSVVLFESVLPLLNK
jgi:hypothetical protein